MNKKVEESAKEIYVKRLGTAYLNDTTKQHFISQAKDCFEIAELFYLVLDTKKAEQQTKSKKAE